MARLEISDDGRSQISIGVAFGTKPPWWVRAMSATADALWRCHLTRAAWTVADLCLWLQKKIKREVA